jgi:hypothetical protein
MSKIDKYISEAQTRAQRCKSPWNILVLLSGFVSIGVITNYLSRFIIYMFQSPEIQFSVISKGNDIELIWIVIPVFLTAIPWGLMLGNIFAWIIPPARRVLDKEAEGHKGCSFKKSMSGLFKMALIISLICIPIAIFASSKIRI